MKAARPNLTRQLGSLLLLLVAACGQAPLSADEPVAGEDGEKAALGSAAPRLRIETDITFTEISGVPLKCDVYRPGDAPGESAETDSVLAKRPAVVVIHGGGWASGDKWTTTGYARALAEAGLIAVTINYRLAPEHKFPAQVDDVRAALVWLTTNADQYGIDTDRVGIFGYSAGAHLACMIGTLVDAEWEVVEPTTRWRRDDPRWKALPKVRGIVGGGAPCEFRNLPLDNTAISYFLGGPRRELPEIYRAASPAAHASAGDCPMLFIHGTSDLIVPKASSRVLFDAQVAAGVCSEYLPLDGLGHMLTYLHPAAQRAAVAFLSDRLTRP